MMASLSCNFFLLLVSIVTFVNNLDASTLIWSDEFSGSDGSGPNPDHWKFDIGGNGWGNNEQEYYTNSVTNAALDGHGHLRINAVRNNDKKYQCGSGKETCKYTSARILTAGHFTPKFGRVEARIKLPHGKGVWPAFWLLGNNIGSKPWPGCGEIDIMEMQGSSPNTVSGTIHGPGYSGRDGIHDSYFLPNGGSFSDDFHVFAIDWSENKITWSVDGHTYRTRTPADLNGKQWVFNDNFFIILNLAIGGNFVGDPDGSTTFPQSMVVDYVRVYKN